MKKLSIMCFALLFLAFGASGAFATSDLYDWEILVNGTSYMASDVYLPPTVGGEITEVSGFSMFTPTDNPSGDDVPEAIGRVEATFNPGMAGDYNIEGYFDVETDE